MGSLGARIAYLRNKRGISQEELARYLKIGKSTLGMYETDRREPSYETTQKIATYFEVTIDWLVTGKEKKMSAVLSEKDKKIIELYDALGEKGKDYILDLMEKMSEANKK